MVQVSARTRLLAFSFHGGTGYSVKHRGFVIVFPAYIRYNFQPEAQVKHKGAPSKPCEVNCARLSTPMDERAGIFSRPT
jgi:hypothetical protein